MDNYPELQTSFAPDFSPVVDPAGGSPVSITLVNYSHEFITERVDLTPEECQTYLTDDTFTWVHVQGQPSPRLLMEFGKLFDLHPLALEDVINIGERSKTETFENQMVVILGMPVKRGTRIISEQVTFFLGENYLISFHNGDEDPFKAVKRRLHHPKAALRTRELDYLLYVQRVDLTPEECQTYLTDDTFTWVHVQGQPSPRLLMEFGKLFDLHPLALEDVINIGERSKTETFENQMVVILGMPVKRGTRIISEQVTFFLGENYLISFHNGDEDPFKAVKRRLHHPKAALRTRELDYLLYVLVDVIIDHGFPILDEFDDEIEQVEQQLLGPEGVDTFKVLYIIKRELLVLRLKIRPQREALRVLMRDDNNMLNEETKIYLRDCYDHVSRLIDMIEIYRDMTSNMLDVHLSLVNKNTFLSNEVQRKATVWAMLFAPLTFITGIYGMNFANIPELHWAYGFIIAIAVMAGIGVLLAVIFKRRNWL